MVIKHEDPLVQRIGNHIANTLADLESIVGKNYKLTLIGRYIKDDLDDADIIISDDELLSVEETVKKMRKNNERT